MKALKRLCQVNVCQLLFIASVDHVTSAGVSQYIVIYRTVPPPFCPVLGPAATALSPSFCTGCGWGSVCMQLAWREPAEAASVCHFSVVTPCLQLYTHARLPSLSRLKLVLGFCPSRKNAEGFTVLVRGPISVVLGWEAWWVSQEEWVMTF